MKLVVGLGNPGREYEKTRHNVGFEFIDRLAEKYDITVDERKFRGLVGKGMIGGEKVILLKPHTFMNLSGESVVSAMNFYKLALEDLIVVFDDISLEPGKIRIRRKGSAGGHNGIKSIIKHLSSEDFSRIKIGVGEKKAGWDLADHVLSVFPKSELEQMERAYEDSIAALAVMLCDMDKAMNQYN